MKRFLIAMSSILAALVTSQARATTTLVYNINVVEGSFSVTGTITAPSIGSSGIGSLGSTGLVDWDLNITNGVTTANLTGFLSGNNSVPIFSTDYFATPSIPSTLLFDFSGIFDVAAGFEGPGATVIFEDAAALNSRLGLDGTTGDIIFDFGAGETSFPEMGEVQIGAVGTTSTTPLPAALSLFATGLSGLGLLAWRRKRKNAAALPQWGVKSAGQSSCPRE
jgi:hypothetical protein